MQLTFRERYCDYWSISSEQFEEHLLLRALYPHARGLHRLLAMCPDYFYPDHEFIRSVALLRSRRLFHGEVGEYHADPANHGFLRRWLRLRLSTDRVRHLMEECWGQADSTAPMPLE